VYELSLELILNSWGFCGDVRFTGSSEDKHAVNWKLRALGSSRGGLQGAGSGLCGTQVDCRHCKSSVSTLSFTSYSSFVFCESFWLNLGLMNSPWFS
jgi:hypothetical protein